MDRIESLQNGCFEHVFTDVQTDLSSRKVRPGFGECCPEGLSLTLRALRGPGIQTCNQLCACSIACRQFSTVKSANGKFNGTTFAGGVDVTRPLAEPVKPIACGSEHRYSFGCASGTRFSVLLNSFCANRVDPSDR